MHGAVLACPRAHLHLGLRFDLIEVIDRPVGANAHSGCLADLIDQAVQVRARCRQQAPIASGGTDDVDESLPEPIVAADVVLYYGVNCFERCEQASHCALGQPDVVGDIGDALWTDGECPQDGERARDRLHRLHGSPLAAPTCRVSRVLCRIVELFCCTEHCLMKRQ